MNHQFDYFEQQLIKAGLVNTGETVMGFLDADLSWNRTSANQPFLELLFENLSINSLLISQPAEPYRTIIHYLASDSEGVILPRDCETRTFLHDLPVSDTLSPDTVIPLLKQRKSVIVPDYGIITYGTVSLEQAFVTFSSVCFTSFVKFFSDYLADTKADRVTPLQKNTFNRVKTFLNDPPEFKGTLKTGPFLTEEEVMSAMAEAGKLTVEHRLVDSYFGNLSCRLGNTLYISQTGSSLDHLSGCIDPCPMDDSSCASITASSELTAHMEIINTTGHTVILHGHPRFSVILSMDCDVEACTPGDTCYLTCPHKRDVCGIPVVPGEVGTGPFGLCNTVPRALKGNQGAIVYGHGLFTTSQLDFNDAFKNLLQIESMCRTEYFKRLCG